MILALRMAALVLAVTAAACTNGQGADQASPGEYATPTPPSPEPPIPLVVRDYTSLVQALEQAGASVRPAGSFKSEFFLVGGRKLTIDGRASVQVLQYGTVAAAERAAATISGDGDTIRLPSGGSAIIHWGNTPHFFQSGRILVLYIGRSRQVTSTLQDLLGSQVAGGAMGN
jgi:hypothetical protein